ncbi:MAG TPA: alpha/beta hydrolase [Stellaceae bacterium]|nr:alpha/beta hydrolase [Stellaceae bacterium]
MIPSSFLSLDGADTVFAVAAPDGAVLPVYELAGPARAPALLFGHANGLAAGSYAPWLKDLAKDARIFAYDARGNGGSSWPAGPLDRVFRVERLAEDLRLVADAVTARLGGAVPAYLGHSLGGAAAIDLAISGRLPRFPALMLIEPPIFPAPGAASHDEAVRIQERLIAGSRRRRADWPSVAAFYERLKSGNSVFAKFPDAMLQAHCRATLKPKPEGGFTLCCPPEVEGAIYEAHRFSGSWSGLARVTMPLDLVGGDANRPDRDWISGAITDMAKQMPRAHLTVLEGAGHLMICEEPARLLALVRRWLGG